MVVALISAMLCELCVTVVVEMAFSTRCAAKCCAALQQRL
jgi:hypothetical protein